MRIFIFFDLPTDTTEDKKNYSRFRKELFKLGYTMMQYSVYHKCINVHTKKDREEKKLIEILPKYGDVRMLCVTENQYQDIKLLKGEKTLIEKINNEKKYIKL
ncbi:MAG: CRISPR-associated endonuclease Cas2 [Mycoplasmataceae bacterium]|jgi:CRISPR-associated protein Cas2|nr:CRISPR-associated endonuclease Cas2 [Mycoplasmataceae bacterium]